MHPPWIADVDYNITVSVDSTNDENPSDNFYSSVMNVYSYCHPLVWIAHMETDFSEFYIC